MMRKICFTYCLQVLLLLVLASNSQAMDKVAVAWKAVPQFYEFDARIEAVNEATVSSRIAAQVIEINYDVDDRVPQDAVIIRFRDTEFKARLAQATSALHAEQAQYQEALARRTEAVAEAKRMSDLFERKQVTRSALDKAQADKSAALARVSALAAQIKVRQAQVEEAEVALSYTTIRAPYAGIVTQRHIELGEMASPGQVLMSGVSLNALRAVVSVPQRLIEQVAQTSASKVFYQNSWINGGQLTVIPEADSQSHSFTVRISLDDGLKLYPGTITKLRFIHGTEQLLMIPATAILQRSEVAGVYVDTPQGIVFRQVRLGREQDGWIEVLAGVQPGEQLLASPHDYLKAR